MENQENNVQENKLPLGRRLRQRANTANIRLELERFEEKLASIADQGKTSVYFADLRTEIPTLIQSNAYIQWFKEQELIIQGAIKADTGAYEYTISW